MSTGDTGKITVTVTPPGVAETLSFAGTSSPTSNPNSSGAVTLTISGSGSGTITSSVTASPTGNSGVYKVTASAGGATSTNSTTIYIPPQILIQMMYAEANGQNDSCREALGLAFRNRMGNSTYWPGVTTYQGAIPGQASYNTSITTGVQNYLNDSVAVWSSSLADYTGGSGCFWSPTYAQWQTVQSALSSGTTTFPANVGDPGCYKTVSGYGPQIVYLSSVGTSTRGGKYAGAPAFLFERKRATTGSVPAAVVQLN